MRFPPGFLWGASSSGYQTEGDNIHSAIWEWELKKGWEPSGKAVDSWRLWEEDVSCLKSLNLNAYRFSVEWSRVEPTPGRYQDEVLERYALQAAALKEAGIRPIVCLHHFSDPAWLYRSGAPAWKSRETIEHFWRFAEKVAAALGSSVQDWITFNEPMNWLMKAYVLGHLPPGERALFSPEAAIAGSGILKNVIDAHTEAYRRIKLKVPGAKVGISQNVCDLEPARPDLNDLRAAADWDNFMHRRVYDLCSDNDSLDFLGVSYYTRVIVRKAVFPGTPFNAVAGYGELEKLLGPWLFRLAGGRRGPFPRSGAGWEIVPDGLGRVVRRLWERFQRPILVTESGVDDRTGELRQDFIRTHLASLGQAIEMGAQVSGYLHWSLLDSYEWGTFAPKYGLFHVDRAAGFARTPAPGAAFLAQAAKCNEVL